MVLIKDKYPTKRAFVHPSLYKFLLENHALELFRANCKRQEEDNFNEFWDTRHSKIIRNAFSFAKAPEGFTYWERLDKEFTSQSSNL